MVNLAQRIQADQLNASIATAISSREGVMGIARAEELGLPTLVVPRKAYNAAEPFSEHVFDLVREAEADYVCLTGFLSLLNIPADYRLRVMNVHPSLLPAFGGEGMYGKHVHRAVLESGCKITGCTVHFCDQQYDTGPILHQRSCRVADDDTPESLSARVGEQEAEAYPEALQLLTRRRITVDGRRSYVE